VSGIGRHEASGITGREFPYLKVLRTRMEGVIRSGQVRSGQVRSGLLSPLAEGRKELTE
jgi:hypothetical protein